MVRAAFGAFAAVIIAPSAASILRLLYTNIVSIASTDSGNHLGRGFANGHVNGRRDAFIFFYENDLESYMFLMRDDDEQETEEMGDLFAHVRRQAVAGSSDHTLRRTSGLHRAVAVVDRVALMMSAWPYTRAIVSIIFSLAFITFIGQLQAAETRGDSNTHLIFCGIVAISIYIIADLILEIRILTINQESQSMYFRFVRRLRAPLTRAAAIFQQPTAARAIETEKCAICTNDIADSLAVLACGHSFHRMCVLRWAETSGGGTCPICRIEYAL